jgi:hypothetical protein
VVCRQSRELGAGDLRTSRARGSNEAAKKLNGEKNGVKISNVLDAVLRTQIAQLEESIKRKNQTEFQKSYDETLSACNGCHMESGHRVYPDY